MKLLANMKVRAKMIFIVVMVTVLLAIMTVFAVAQLRSVSALFTTVIDHPIAGEKTCVELENNFRNTRRCVSTFAIYMGIDPQMLESAYTTAKESYDETLKHLGDYEENVKTNPEYKQEDIDVRLAKAETIRGYLEKYWSETAEPCIAAARGNDRERFVALALQTGQVAQDIEAEVASMIEAAESAAQAKIEETRAAEIRATFIMIGIAALTLAAAMVIALAISDSISKPLGHLAAFMKKAGATGDITLQAHDIETIEKAAQSKDEVGVAIAGCAAFLSHVSKVAEELGHVASGDLSVNIALLSNADTMGKALHHMVENLNHMFGEIQTSTVQVNAGAQLIADGSQALAQGSTQQAASVEQLSSSISEIADKTKTNAEMAGKAAMLGSTIMSNAEKGNRQMDDMMTAVKDINAASQQISRVIKVIDDIAFQTNILALNAAVEAARAGQHGKGFAVVAEEVRSLASKSAEAAKDTGNLIANSMEKAELGSRIAEETSASLAEIVSGINESSQLISQIAQLSDEQSAGITQIDKGINQVAQVVHQNSATAEESAAAAEEMSGQSQMLEGLMSQFKLKDGSQSLTFQNLIAMPEAAATGGGDYGKY